MNIFIFLVGFATGVPVVSNPPSFSWDALGNMTFCHGSTRDGFTTAQLAFLRRFSIVQWDKKQDKDIEKHGSIEDRNIKAALTVKGNNYHSIQIPVYINSILNFKESRMHRLIPDNLLLADDSGSLVKIRGQTLFDLRQAKMRKIVVDNALYSINLGVDGVFIDRANWANSSQCHPNLGKPLCRELFQGQRQLFDDLVNALGSRYTTLAKEVGATVMSDWQVANAVMTSDSFCSEYCDNCSPDVDPKTMWSDKDAERCLKEMIVIETMSNQGQLTTNHAMGPMNNKDARLFVIAAFLIAAGDLSFFSYVDWTNPWDLDGVSWIPEYDLPLGRPTSPANTCVPGEKWKYVRTFESGTRVYVDLSTREVSIAWGNTTPIIANNMTASNSSRIISKKQMI